MPRAAITLFSLGIVLTVWTIADGGSASALSSSSPIKPPSDLHLEAVAAKTIVEKEYDPLTAAPPPPVLGGASQPQGQLKAELSDNFLAVLGAPSLDPPSPSTSADRSSAARPGSPTPPASKRAATKARATVKARGPRADFQAGLALYDAGKEDLALPYLENAAAKGHAEAMVLVGSIHQEKGRTEQSRQLYQRYLSGHPRGAHAVAIRSILEQL